MDKTLEFLKQTNPAYRWIKERFQIHLGGLKNGNAIIIFFDLESCGSYGYRFNEDIIEEKFSHCIDPAEYENIALRLNEKMVNLAQDVFSQIKTAQDILDALSAKRYYIANLLIIKLTDHLLRYEEQATPIWGDWVMAVADLAEYGGMGEDELGFF